MGCNSHSNDPINGASTKASKGAQKDKAHCINLETPKEFKLQGTRLSVIAQNLAYIWITHQEGLKPITLKGQENLKDTIEALEETGSPAHRAENME